METEALAREKQQKRRSLFQNHLDSLADEESDQSEGSLQEGADSKVVLVND
jgi:hypothetical protein